LAYPESADDTDPDPTAPCTTCHGLESDVESPTVAPTRTGPHGGYNTGTSKCATCHSVHTAPAGSVLLLPAATIISTCNTCHDGTGGGGVYGVIRRVTGKKPSGHRVGFSLNGQITVPGGDESGGSLARSATTAVG
jgi:hypothetical protein